MAGFSHSLEGYMARRPDLPCADCGKLLWRDKTSLPAGQARCRPCRRSIPISPASRHGASLYRKKGCRCDECKTSVRLEARAYVARVKDRDGFTPTEKTRGKTKTSPCTKCGTAMKRWQSSDPICSRCRARDKHTICIRNVDRFALYDQRSMDLPDLHGRS